MYRSVWMNVLFAGVATLILFAIGIPLGWADGTLGLLAPVAMLLGMLAYGAWSGEGFPPRAPR